MFSAALKNIFEFVNYKETEGKTAGLTIVAGGMISFGDVQTLFTQLMSYFRVITNPTAVYSTGEKIVDNTLQENPTKLPIEKKKPVLVLDKILIKDKIQSKKSHTYIEDNLSIKFQELKEKHSLYTNTTLY